MNTYTLTEIMEMIKGKVEQQPAFWGEVTLTFQDRKIVLWSEIKKLKPSGTTEKQKRLFRAMEH